MKKLALFLALIMVAALLAACGGDVSDRNDKDDHKIEQDDDKGNKGDKNDKEDKDDKEEGKETETEAEEEFRVEDVEFFYTGYYQDGMISGNYSTNDGYINAVIDKNGDPIFTLDEERDLVFTDMGDEKVAYFGDYALLSDNTVIDRKGKTVFDLADTDFDKIYYSYCLDVGFLLVSKDVNSFEETGTHYYAYNIKDGTSYKFEGTFAPMSEGHQYYFGNGIFIYSPANSGFGTKHTFINIVENKEYQGYKLDENGEKVYERLPDFYFHGDFKNSKGKPITTVDNIYYAKDDEERVVYNIETGEVKLTNIGDIISNENFSNDKSSSKVPYLVKMKMSGESYMSDKFLLNLRTGKYFTMNDYATYDIYMHNTAEDTYLAFVTNEGGGKFMTVLDKDGKRVFDPVAVDTIFKYNEKLIVTNFEGNTEVYNWKGEKLDSIEGTGRATLGESSIMFEREIDGRECTVLRTFDGNETVVTTLPIVEKYRLRAMSPSYYVDGHYVYDSFFITDDGEVTVLYKK